MATYVILSRISPQAFDDPKDFKDLAKDVSEKIKRQCPGVTWKESFATLGRFDVVDIVPCHERATLFKNLSLRNQWPK